MKVIGLGENKYICEVSDDEIWSLVDNHEDSDEMMIEAGDEIDLARVIKAAKWIKQLDTEHIDRVIRELQLALVGVEKVKHTAEALNLFNKLGDKELS